MCLRHAKDLYRRLNKWLNLPERKLSIRLYHEEYPRLLWAIIASFVTFGVLLFWGYAELDVLIKEPSWEHFDRFAHPLFLFLVSVIGVLVRSHLSGSLISLGAKIPATPIEEIEDQTTKPWRYINHSFSKIRWRPDIGREALKVIQEHYSKNEHYLNKTVYRVFERLLEETSTDNYRVFSFFGVPRLIRIHKARVEYDLKCRKSVVAHLIDKSVFRSNVLHCLTPLHTGTTGVEGEGPYYEIFPYLDVEAHYAGNTLGELKSFATKFGCLQASLQKVNREHPDYELLSKNPKNNKLVCKKRTAKEISCDWEKILDYVREHPYSRSVEPYVKILEGQNELGNRGEGNLTQLVSEASVFLERNAEEPEYLLLNDVHPHNVFCKGNECFLIYDFSWIGLWPHTWVVAFSLHRFVREYVIKNTTEYMEDITAEREKLLRNGIRSFVDSYTDGVESFENGYAHKLKELPADFEPNLGAYIRSSNIDRMLDSFMLGMGLKEEIGKRPEARLIGEARKFVRFMEESKEFSLS